jgi:hypothetical protein
MKNSPHPFRIGGAAMSETASQKASRYAEQRRRRTEQLMAWECKQLNRQRRTQRQEAKA